MFAYQVRDPERYGVVEFDADGRPIAIEEKPAHADARNWAVTGLYFYDTGWSTSPPGSGRRAGASWRSPTSTGRTCEAGDLHVERLGRGIAWLDTGTPESLLQAANFVQTIEERQGLIIACLEEIAYQAGRIDADEVRRVGRLMKSNSYGQHLLRLVDEKA